MNTYEFKESHSKPDLRAITRATALGLLLFSSPTQANDTVKNQARDTAPDRPFTAAELQQYGITDPNDVRAMEILDTVHPNKAEQQAEQNTERQIRVLRATLAVIFATGSRNQIPTGKFLR